MIDNLPILLGVNIDHIATIRQARMTLYPEPVQAALVAEQAGADGITAHLREDRRHIQDRDIRLLRDMIHTKLNLEMAATGEMVKIAKNIKPDSCCLVPEKREELTTEGGLDVAGHLENIKAVCNELNDAGCNVSLFIDADFKQIDAAKQSGAAIIELHTGFYAERQAPKKQQKELDRIKKSSKYAKDLGLQVNAGHGLHYHNVEDICLIPEIVELNIGHAIIARAAISGLDPAVREMKLLMRRAHQRLQIQNA